jgi:hypothetical protein
MTICSVLIGGLLAFSFSKKNNKKKYILNFRQSMFIGFSNNLRVIDKHIILSNVIVV